MLASWVLMALLWVPERGLVASAQVLPFPAWSLLASHFSHFSAAQPMPAQPLTVCPCLWSTAITASHVQGTDPAHGTDPDHSITFLCLRS